jgi:hypothetical protein
MYMSLLGKNITKGLENLQMGKVLQPPEHIGGNGNYLILRQSSEIEKKYIHHGLCQ